MLQGVQIANPTALPKSAYGKLSRKLRYFEFVKILAQNYGVDYNKIVKMRRTKELYLAYKASGRIPKPPKSIPPRKFEETPIDMAKTYQEGGPSTLDRDNYIRIGSKIVRKQNAQIPMVADAPLPAIMPRGNRDGQPLTALDDILARQQTAKLSETDRQRLQAFNMSIDGILAKHEPEFEQMADTENIDEVNLSPSSWQITQKNSPLLSVINRLMIQSIGNITVYPLAPSLSLVYFMSKKSYDEIDNRKLHIIPVGFMTNVIRSFIESVSAIPSNVEFKRNRTRSSGTIVLDAGAVSPEQSNLLISDLLAMMIGKPDAKVSNETIIAISPVDLGNTLTDFFRIIGFNSFSNVSTPFVRQALRNLGEDDSDPSVNDAINRLYSLLLLGGNSTPNVIQTQTQFQQFNNNDMTTARNIYSTVTSPENKLKAIQNAMVNAGFSEEEILRLLPIYRTSIQRRGNFINPNILRRDLAIPLPDLLKRIFEEEGSPNEKVERIFYALIAHDYSQDEALAISRRYLELMNNDQEFVPVDQILAETNIEPTTPLKPTKLEFDDQTPIDYDAPSSSRDVAQAVPVQTPNQPLNQTSNQVKFFKTEMAASWREIKNNKLAEITKKYDSLKKYGFNFAKIDVEQVVQSKSKLFYFTLKNASFDDKLVFSANDVNFDDGITYVSPFSGRRYVLPLESIEFVLPKKDKSDNSFFALYTWIFPSLDAFNDARAQFLTLTSTSSTKAYIMYLNEVAPKLFDPQASAVTVTQTINTGNPNIGRGEFYNVNVTSPDQATQQILNQSIEVIKQQYQAQLDQLIAQEKPKLDALKQRRDQEQSADRRKDIQAKIDKLIENYKRNKAAIVLERDNALRSLQGSGLQGGALSNPSLLSLIRVRNFQKVIRGYYLQNSVAYVYKIDV